MSAHLDAFEVELQRGDDGRAAVVLYCCACGENIEPVDGASVAAMVELADAHRCEQ
jgi:hypothetical protein